MKRLHVKLTYANVISTLCLFLLVGGGTALAATQLGKNSVGSTQLKAAAVTPVKLSAAAKTALTGLSGPKGETGATGPQGPMGEKGDTGAKGDSGEAGLRGEPGNANVVTIPLGPHDFETESVFRANIPGFTYAELSQDAWQVQLEKNGETIYDLPGPGFNGATIYKAWIDAVVSGHELWISRVSGPGEAYDAVRIIVTKSSS